MDNIFEKAMRQKLRFSTAKGELSVEDLWDLKLKDLDLAGRAIKKQLKDEEEESLISKPSKLKSELTLKLEIVKSIIAYKQEEEQKAKTRAANKAQAEFLQELLHKKKMNVLENMTAEEIEVQLASLKGDEENE